MRKMKDSGIAWIGEIPEGWETKRLKFICTINPMVNIDDINPETEVSFLPMENIKYGYFVNTIIKNFSEYCSSYNIFNDGDILLAKVTPCFENGNIAIANNLKNCIGFGTSEIFVVRVNNIDNKFLFYYFRNELFRQRAIATMSGTGGLKRISPQFMRDENVLFPPLPEQHRIASYLNAKCAEIDRNMELVRQSMDKLKAYRMSVITEAVTKGLDPDVPMQDSGVPWIGEIPDGWECLRLKFTLTQSLQYGANAAGSAYEENLPRYIRITDIDENGNLKSDNKQSLQTDEAADYLLEDGDVLLARSGATVGKSFLYKKEYGLAAFAGYLIRAKFNSNILLYRYFYHITQSYSYFEWKNYIFVQATIQNIGADKYSNFQLPLPPLAEQHRIASYLDAKCAEIDAIIAQKQALLDKLAAYKKSLIFECVTGKREVAA
ncbi:restriction endonuclease subunit S [Desulfovibrio sp. ZJ200]|uniref:restriction endonuclease subunit S n=1 Tax=Desulfovibrio sp. ZJ200 TaxID=2709792 RepID=UPI0013EACF0A|nr:restriction endonuclease subunit S [Desulfovibrio sp. ZJ200]